MLSHSSSLRASERTGTGLREVGRNCRAREQQVKGLRMVVFRVGATEQGLELGLMNPQKGYYCVFDVLFSSLQTHLSTDCHGLFTLSVYNRFSYYSNEKNQKSYQPRFVLGLTPFAYGSCEKLRRKTLANL
jgi:hypothetical protein